MLPDRPIRRAFHATQEATGEITVRRVNPSEGISDIFTFKDADELRSMLAESYKPRDLELLLHELAKEGCVVFYAESSKGQPKKLP